MCAALALNSCLLFVYLLSYYILFIKSLSTVSDAVRSFNVYSFLWGRATSYQMVAIFCFIYIYLYFYRFFMCTLNYFPPAIRVTSGQTVVRTENSPLHKYCSFASASAVQHLIPRGRDSSCASGTWMQSDPLQPLNSEVRSWTTVELTFKFWTAVWSSPSPQIQWSWTTVE